MPTTNLIPRRFFTGGGLLKLDDGSAVHEMRNVTRLRWTNGLTQAIEYTDQGVAQEALRGDTGYSTIEFTARRAHSSTPANDIENILSLAGTTHLMKQFSVVVDVPDHPGASTGKRYTWTKCHVQPEPTGMDGQVNNEHDEMSWTLRSPDRAPAETTFGGG